MLMASRNRTHHANFLISALMLLVGWQERHPACKKTKQWGVGMVICLERGAFLHMAQLMPLPLTVCCFSKIQIGFTFLATAHLGSPGKMAANWVYACMYAYNTTIYLEPLHCRSHLIFQSAAVTSVE